VRTPRGDFAALLAHPEEPVRGTVLLIPGFTGSKEDFTPLLPLLAAQGWCAATYDQRGQYETPGSHPGAYTLDELAADARAIADAVSAPGLPRHLLGHSFGGLVAQTAVLNAPADWQSLVLLCSGPGGFGADDTTTRLRALVELIETATLETVHAHMRADDRRRGKPLPPPEIAAFTRTRFLANAPASLKAMARLLIDAPDRIDELAALELPCAVVRGADDDASAHAVQDDMAARLGTATVIISDAAHSPAVENPVATARVLGAFFDSAQGQPCPATNARTESAIS